MYSRTFVLISRSFCEWIHALDNDTKMPLSFNSSSNMICLEIVQTVTQILAQTYDSFKNWMEIFKYTKQNGFVAKVL